eukprot:g28606.t1
MLKPILGRFVFGVAGGFSPGVLNATSLHIVCVLPNGKCICWDEVNENVVLLNKQAIPSNGHITRLFLKKVSVSLSNWKASRRRLALSELLGHEVCKAGTGMRTKSESQLNQVQVARGWLRDNIFVLDATNGKQMPLENLPVALDSIRDKCFNLGDSWCRVPAHFSGVDTAVIGQGHKGVAVERVAAAITAQFHSMQENVDKLLTEQTEQGTLLAQLRASASNAESATRLVPTILGDLQEEVHRTLIGDPTPVHDLLQSSLPTGILGYSDLVPLCNALQKAAILTVGALYSIGHTSSSPLGLVKELKDAGAEELANISYANALVMHDASTF